ncbi:hypothetical protein [Accumulibacter sp.]|uniref:hypothetical protein n=1 Tax=Accumulibacter sp. TaxID=2053492 RepID=UPI002CEECA11|nr:hypothetical protein [Accumulibacter sp.]HMW57593.1 hypothetical protein [Accumulibacter sp.]HNA49065.1 hypothetical protein [Nitrospira sp.]HNG17507.1 hypothetical protein [Accumulibacter sp.]
MARIRTIKPEFWASEQIMDCSPNARLLFIGMWNFCDDAGIHPASPKTLKAEIFPSDDISASKVEDLVGELIAQGLLERYEVAERPYWVVTGWHHQRIDQPTYKHPQPDGTVPAGAARRRAERQQVASTENVRNLFGEHHANGRRPVDECSPPEGNGRERSGHGSGDGYETHVAQSALPPAPLAASEISRIDSAGDSDSSLVPIQDYSRPDCNAQVSPQRAKPAKRGNPGAAKFKARFEEFWDTFAYKHGKTRAMKAWMAVCGAEKADADLAALADDILRAAEIEALRRPTLVATGRTPIYPEGWLSQRRWEDEGLLSWGQWSPEEQAFVDVFNANIGDACPHVTEWTEKRSELTKVAVAGKMNLDRWGDFWRFVRDGCEFRFPVSYEWFLRRENFAAVADGQYNKETAAA